MKYKDDLLVIDVVALKRIMKHKKLTNNSLAKLMNVSPSTVWRIVNNKRGLSSNMIGKLLSALDMDIDDIDKLFIFNSPLPKGKRLTSS